MKDVQVPLNPFERFSGIIDAGQFASYLEKAEDLRRRFEGRTVWNINTTDAGGGVAEMLRSLIAYVRGFGIDGRWIVMEAGDDFFRVTKRLHHSLHGSPGDGTPLDEEARRIYDEATRQNAGELLARVRPRDVVLVHDPQPAGLITHLIRAGALVVWRCHIGHDTPNQEVERGWSFLTPYLKDVPAMVFSRHAYIPSDLDGERATIITPSVDAFSPKNQELDDDTIHSILVHVGIVEGPDGDSLSFTRQDGSPGRVDRQADIVRLGRPPAFETPLVVQVSRWDPLKDPVGVMHGFGHLVEVGRAGDAHLVLAGPNVHAIADDPEGGAVLDSVIEEWRQLPHAVRHRVHVVCLPMTDFEENAAIVNALQRHATIIVQKSLHEGFGLTVTEAMWKARAVLASAVGGIQDQIEDDVHGLLLKDPRDLQAFARQLERLLHEPELREVLGRNAKQHVRDNFLGVHSLIRHGHLIECLDEAHEECGRPEEFTIGEMRRQCCHLTL
jgi:trehalose synthase